MKTQSRLINFLIDEQKEAALRIIAKQDSRNLSETLREILREEAKRRGLWPIGLLQKDGNAQVRIGKI